MHIVAIVNPVSGAGMDPTVAERRVALLGGALRRRSLTASIHLTKRAGHARELAASAAADGAALVLVWGGDGTVNEVGGALVGSRTALGLIPAGSGNGLAAALAVPRTPEAALEKALSSPPRVIDVGMLAGRPFFNVAGVGFDARVARLFNERARGTRGRWPYVLIGVREGCTYCGRDYEIELDGERLRERALLVAFANGTEFGMGARIAPDARLDDGLLDVCVVGDRTVLERFWHARHLALASIARAPGVLFRRIRAGSIASPGQIEYHVDGECGSAVDRIDVGLMPGALRVNA